MTFSAPTILALAIALLGLPLIASDEPPLAIRPTVTVETGDTGGRFFGQVPDPRKTRHYYIAAESNLWDFAPSGRDDVSGRPLPRRIANVRTREKLRYFQYTDQTFSARTLPTPALGILGPVLRGVAGEYLAVTFFNRTWRPLSMHPHGVRYDPDSDGTYQRDPGRGAAVGPLAKFTYVWKLDEKSAPAPGEPSSKAWLYHSHVAGDAETNLGLVGCIVVTDPRRARADGTPQDVDREFATLFMNFNESGLDDEADEGPLPPIQWELARQLVAEGTRATINGYVFGNLPGLVMNEGERTRWYLLALGSEQDFHSASWEGLRVIEDGRRRTTAVNLMPATVKVADCLADAPGTWLFGCQVAEHRRDGMFARVFVHAESSPGADRSPAAAFLGLPAAARSLRIERVAITSSKLDVEGVATTLFEGLDVSQEPVRVSFAGKSVEFRANQQGIARADGALLRVKNGDAFGFVHDGLIEFALEFNRAVWLGPNVKNTTAVPLSIEFTQMRHVGEIAIPPDAR